MESTKARRRPWRRAGSSARPDASVGVSRQGAVLLAEGTALTDSGLTGLAEGGWNSGCALWCQAGGGGGVLCPEPEKSAGDEGEHTRRPEQAGVPLGVRLDAPAVAAPGELGSLAGTWSGGSCLFPETLGL